MTFSKNLFWPVNCTLSFYQFFTSKFKLCNLRLTSQVKSCLSEIISWESHLHLLRSMLSVSFQLIPWQEICKYHVFSESQCIELFVFGGSNKKFFSVDSVNIYPFSIFFSMDFARKKKLFSILSIFIFSQYFFE